MMLTEKEATEKWCPFGRVAYRSSSGGIVVSNRLIPASPKMDDIAGSLCIGSRCMVWAWRERPDNDGHRRGYCGLATYVGGN